MQGGRSFVGRSSILVTGRSRTLRAAPVPRSRKNAGLLVSWAGPAEVSPYFRNSKQSGPQQSGAGNGHFIDLVPVRIDNADEPVAPIPCLHDKTVLDVTRERNRILACSGISRQFDALVIL